MTCFLLSFVTSRHVTLRWSTSTRHTTLHYTTLTCAAGARGRGRGGARARVTPSPSPGSVSVSVDVRFEVRCACSSSRFLVRPRVVARSQASKARDAYQNLKAAPGLLSLSSSFLFPLLLLFLSSPRGPFVLRSLFFFLLRSFVSRPRSTAHLYSNSQLKISCCGGHMWANARHQGIKA